MAYVVAVTAAVAWCGLASAPALAHTGLESSDPVAGQRLARLPETVTLTFGEAVGPELAAITLGRVGGHVRRLAPRQGSESNVLVASVPKDITTHSQPPAAGGTSLFVLRFRVTSADGHPVEGELDFTVKASPAPASSSPTGSPEVGEADDVDDVGTAPNDPAVAATTSTSSSATKSTLVIGALALLGTAVPCVFLLRARRRAQGEEE